MAWKLFQSRRHSLWTPARSNALVLIKKARHAGLFAACHLANLWILLPGQRRLGRTQSAYFLWIGQ